jgi:hypothetical protein
MLIRKEAVRAEALPEGGDGAFLLGVANVLDGDGRRREAEVDAPPAALLDRVDGLPPQRPDLAPPPLVLRVAVAQGYLDVPRMDHCTDWHLVHHQTPQEKRCNLQNQEQQLIPYTTFSAPKLGPRVAPASRWNGQS